MNWEAIGAVAEAAGTIVVIVTLFYLAVQVKHSSAVAQAAARQEVSHMNIESLGFSLDTQCLSSAARKTTLGEELTPDEHSNYLRWVLTRMRVFENAHYQYKRGLLPEEEWTGYERMIFGLAGPDSYARAHWEWAAPGYSPSFVAEVDKIINSTRSIPPVPLHPSQQTRTS